MKKDNDLLKYQKNMSDKVLKLTVKNIQLQNVIKESSDRVGSDGCEPSTLPAQEEQSERRQVKDKAHHGAPKSRMREERSTDKRTPDYKRNPVYPGMKKVLKDTNLSKRKYKMAKKQLQEDCERLLLMNN